MSNLEQFDPINHLLVESWAAYDRLCDESFVVRPAMPILFFGDISRYFTSPLKVVTVGLNPSSVEFPEADRFARFPSMQPLGSNGTHLGGSNHLDSLAAYFRTNSYRKWFGSFESILTGMESSYYDLAPNSALHTDLCGLTTMPLTSEGCSGTAYLKDTGT